YHRRLYRLLHALLHDLKTLTSFFPLGKLFGTLYAEQNDSIGPTFPNALPQTKSWTVIFNK
ncbi:MAG: hypothetical protein WAV59_04465, partial [Trichococcus flocculiformis]